jgi:DNA-binding response OmpR family regulator
MTRLASILVAGADSERGGWLVDTLHANNVKVVTEASASALIEAVRRDRPDLLIIDTDSTEMDGLQLAADMGRDTQTADIPVVLATSHRSAQGFENALRVGADDTIETPGNAEAVLIRLLPLLRLSTMHAERKRRRQPGAAIRLAPG